MASPSSHDKLQALDFESEVAKVFLDPAVHDQFVTDIARWAQTNKDLALHFDLVQDRFKELVSRGLDDDSVQYAQKWNDIHEEFLARLDQSRSLAGTMARECDRYFETVVQPAAHFTTVEEIEHESIQALLLHISEFLQDCDNLEKQASETRDKFADIAATIKTFRDQFTDYDAGKLSANAEKVKHLQELFEELRGELKKVEGKLEDAANFVSGSSTAAKVLGIASLFNPIAAIGALASGGVAEGADRLVVDSLKRDAYAIENKMGDLRREQYAVEEENDLISQIKGDLELLATGDIHSVLGGIEYFRVLWAEITADVHGIHGYLDKIKRRASLDTKPEDIPSSVYTFLRTGTTLYYGLSRGLKLYAEGVEEAEKVKWAAPEPPQFGVPQFVQKRE